MLCNSLIDERSTLLPLVISDREVERWVETVETTLDLLPYRRDRSVWPRFGAGNGAYSGTAEAA